ncbi:MAG: NADH-quinone oxidoreductase subunit B [Coriobacteriales bacterium]|nr:NADH-quinone oxidoreductase subunit B [Coriobacteriales bacterium]
MWRAPDRRALGEVPRGLLRLRAGLRGLRRRGRLSLSLGGDHPAARHLRPGPDGDLHRHPRARPGVRVAQRGAQVGVDDQTRVLIAPIQQLMDWARGHSMWPLTFGTACCAIEMMCCGSARYDTDRFGIFFRNSPRQADCMIVAGTINLKMAPRLKLLYEQMAEPKYVIAMGSCAIGGGPFSTGYNVVNGVDQIVPVDIYVPGCPPRPEALINSLLLLMERNSKGERSAADRLVLEQPA